MEQIGSKTRWWIKYHIPRIYQVRSLLVKCKAKKMWHQCYSLKTSMWSSIVKHSGCAWQWSRVKFSWQDSSLWTVCYARSTILRVHWLLVDYRVQWICLHKKLIWKCTHTHVVYPIHLAIYVGACGQVNRALDKIRRSGVRFPVLAICRSAGKTSYSRLPRSTQP